MKSAKSRKTKSHKEVTKATIKKITADESTDPPPPMDPLLLTFSTSQPSILNLLSKATMTPVTDLSIFTDCHRRSSFNTGWRLETITSEEASRYEKDAINLASSCHRRKHASTIDRDKDGWTYVSDNQRDSTMYYEVY